MIWFGVSPDSIPYIFWSTICEIDEAINSINFSSDKLGLMKLVNDWSKKHRDHHGFTTNMSTALALDGFVLKLKSQILLIWMIRKIATDFEGLYHKLPLIPMPR